jgi:hypothetical protein
MIVNGRTDTAAQNLRCPFQRDTGTARCVASACMAWRWTQEQGHTKVPAGYAEDTETNLRREGHEYTRDGDTFVWPALGICGRVK